MKAVVLLAGRGRRICNEISVSHKSLIELYGHPVLWYLINSLKESGIDRIVAVLGSHAEAVRSFLDESFIELRIEYVLNPEFKTTNNLVSLLCTKDHLFGKDFIVLNGDMVFDDSIVKGIMRMNGSAVAVDTIHCNEPSGSPGTIIRDDRIYDLGRHIPICDNSGYAVGIYKLCSEVHRDYFALGEKLASKNPDAGFHDPLREMFESHVIRSFDVGRKLWMDIDQIEDVEKARQYIQLLHRNKKMHGEAMI